MATATAWARALEVDWAWLHRAPDERPLNSVPALVTLAALYLALTWLGTRLMRGRAPFEITRVTVVWNALMAVYSLYAFVGSALTVWGNWANVDFAPLRLLCDADKALMLGMDYWSYHFYLSKYVEYADTLFLVLKGKAMLPPAAATHLLHVYHHSVTASIGFVVARDPVSVAYLGPLTNSFVHIFMYAYYALAEMHLVDRRLGGLLITPLQLAQFFFCIFMGVYETFHLGECNRGTGFFSAVWLWINYSFFLVMFFRLLLAKKSERAARHAAATPKPKTKRA